MTMRLTVTNSSLPTFEHDVNVSPSSKSEVLKFLSVILKNLLKSDDAKFRQLRTTNAKIQRLTAHPAVFAFLTKSVGFVAVPAESVLRISDEPSRDMLEAALKEVSVAFERVDSQIPRTVSNSSSASSLPEMLTEKQKARKLMEEKEAAEKEATRVARKRTQDQIKADKYTRENDPNWKPTVSAAAAKAGDAMATFRDKFGEN